MRAASAQLRAQASLFDRIVCGYASDLSSHVYAVRPTSAKLPDPVSHDSPPTQLTILDAEIMSVVPHDRLYTDRTRVLLHTPPPEFPQLLPTRPVIR